MELLQASRCTKLASDSLRQLVRENSQVRVLQRSSDNATGQWNGHDKEEASACFHPAALPSCRSHAVLREGNSPHRCSGPWCNCQTIASVFLRCLKPSEASHPAAL